MRVLVIEDDRETALPPEIAEESGHSADIAATARRTSMAQSNTYDILIVDRMLPRLDGLSVVDAAHGSHACAHPLRAGDVDDRVKVCGRAATTT